MRLLLDFMERLCYNRFRKAVVYMKIQQIGKIGGGQDGAIVYADVL